MTTLALGGPVRNEQRAATVGVATVHATTPAIQRVFGVPVGFDGFDGFYGAGLPYAGLGFDGFGYDGLYGAAPFGYGFEGAFPYAGYAGFAEPFGAYGFEGAYGAYPYAGYAGFW